MRRLGQRSVVGAGPRLLLLHDLSSVAELCASQQHNHSAAHIEGEIGQGGGGAEDDPPHAQARAAERGVRRSGLDSFRSLSDRDRGETTDTAETDGGRSSGVEVSGVRWMGCGVVWCGVVWCGVVWCGVVWCGVVWCGVVCIGCVWSADLIREWMR